MRYFFLSIFCFLLPMQGMADELRYLAHGDEAFAAFFKITSEAKYSIDATTFIFEPCHVSGQLFLEQLAKKVKEGVKVRLLVDALYLNFSKNQRDNLVAFLANNGIELRWYNDFAFFHPGANFRLHAKFLVVDKQSYITGGRNIGDNYFSMDDKENFIDRDVWVTGDSTAQAALAFEEIWNSSMADLPATAGEWKDWSEVCGDGLNWEKRATVLAYFQKHDPLANLTKHNCQEVNFLSDNPEFGNAIYGPDRTADPSSGPNFDEYMTPERLRLKRTSSGFLNFISETQEKIAFENWSYLPMGKLAAAFQDLRDRNVETTVITNRDMDGPRLLRNTEEALNSTWARRDTVGSERVTLLASNGASTDAKEYSVPGAFYHLHGKVAVRDGEAAAIGSFNLDPRSYSTNLETMLLVTNCPSFTQEVARGTQEVYAAHARDLELGVPEAETPSFFAKFLAFFGAAFF